MLTGGSANPFSIMLLVQIVVSALILPPFWTRIIAAYAVFLFFISFFLYREIPELQHHLHMDTLSLHLHGMFIAFTLATILITLFLNLIAQERFQLITERARLLEEQKLLATLTSLMGIATHELGTPLNTISLLAADLSVSTNREEDISVILKEVARCKRALHALSARSGQLLGEAREKVTLEEIVKCALLNLKDLNRVKTLYLVSKDFTFVTLKDALAHGVEALLKNALEASSDEVTLTINVSKKRVSFFITDLGSGLSKDVLASLGRPFFSTKDKSTNLGLGTYLARLIAENLGGSVTFANAVKSGTIAKLEVAT
jgi:two-component system sensor histidine kinase RegB